MQYQIIENAQIAPNVFLLDVSGDTSMLKAPGQFCQIRLPGFYLRRPISVCDWDERGMTLIYKAVGEGTKALSQMQAGTALDILNGLGNGYSLDACGSRPLLIGGGVGIPPLYGLARALVQKGVTPQAVLGFNTYEEAFLVDEFEDLDIPITVATADGSFGKKGFVTDALPADYDYFFTCGPDPMLRALYKACRPSGQFSLEERMACGFGACMGCFIQTKNGPRRVCKDGPVFRKEELFW
ncbi:MAG: dihydroorotate dehydrogenase electron transfer subunit [Clostridia bacterium]|nr:dihydroorotate dehydrogenase electron transfer subunit [Clostridia bacterium]